MKSAVVLALFAPFALGAPKHRHPVCIVGAGVSGLTAAKALEDKGLQTVLFEKRPVVGGKCQSVYDENGDYYPLGAVLFTKAPTYAETFKLVERTGTNYTEFNSGENWAFNWTTGAVTQAPPLPPEVIQAIGAELALYSQFWQTTYAPFSISSYKNGVPQEFTVPAQQWLLANGYPYLAGVINTALGTYGYGDYTLVPILYILQFFTPDILGSFLGIIQPYKTDFHEVLTRVSKTIKGPIYLGSQIKHISRGKNPTIRYRRASETHHRVQKCSDVIIAFPPTIKALDNAGLDLTHEERVLFGLVGVENYFSSAVRLSAFPDNATFTIQLPNPLTPFDGQGQPVYLVPLHPGSHIVNVWSVDKFGATGSEPRAKGLLTEVLSKLNKNPREPQQQPVPVSQADVLGWSGEIDYFPHLGTEALAGGWYEIFKANQGNQHTYFTSGVNSFELVEFTIRSAQDLVASYFKGVGECST